MQSINFAVGDSHWHPILLNEVVYMKICKNEFL